MKTRLLILDADSLIFTIAYNFRRLQKTKVNRTTKESEPNTRGISRVVQHTIAYVNDIIRGTNATHVIGFVGSKDADAIPNFREALFPVTYDKAINQEGEEIKMPTGGYKYNRSSTPDFIAEWRDIIHETFIKSFGFAKVDSMEADDAVSLTIEKHRDDFDEIVISSEDKDLLEEHGVLYYNPAKHRYVRTQTDDRKKPEASFKLERDEEHTITKLEAAKHMGVQMIMGDKGDCISGLPGMGPTKASEIIDPCETVFDVIKNVVWSYAEHESVLRAKIRRRLVKSTTDDIKGKNLAECAASGNSPYAPKQLQRKVRIAIFHKIGEEVEKQLPGGWKEFIKLQYQLLHMVDSLDEYEGITLRLDIPEPRETFLVKTGGKVTNEDLVEEGDVITPEEDRPAPILDEEDGEDDDWLSFDEEDDKPKEADDDDDDWASFDDDDNTDNTDSTAKAAEEKEEKEVAEEQPEEVEEDTKTDSADSDEFDYTTLKEKDLYIHSTPEKAVAYTCDGAVGMGPEIADVMPKITKYLMEGYSLLSL